MNKKWKSFKVNFRYRYNLDYHIWNKFWDHLKDDMENLRKDFIDFATSLKEDVDFLYKNKIIYIVPVLNKHRRK